MKPICRELQERLAGEGAQAVRADAAAQRHLEECTDCFRVLEELARLDEALAAMPAPDAPDRVVEELLARVRAEGAPPARPAGDTPARRTLARPVFWGLATAASVVLIALMTLDRSALPRVFEAPKALEYDVPVPATPAPARLAPDAEKRAETAERLNGLGYAGDKTAADSAVRQLEKNKKQEDSAVKNGAIAWDKAYRDPQLQAATGKEGERFDESASRRNEKDRLEAKLDGVDESPKGRKADLDDGRGVEGGVAGGVPGGVLGGVVAGYAEGSPAAPPVRVGGAVMAPKQVRRVDPVYPEAARSARVEGTVTLEIEIGPTGRVTRASVVHSIPMLDAAALAAVKQWMYTPTLRNGQAVPATMTVTIHFRLTPASPANPGSSELPSSGPARAFMEEREKTEGLSFQPAAGYWANTYLPGDPALRLLRAHLLAWDRGPLQAQTGFPLRLHDDAVPPAQPFDAPRSAGLAVYLHADRAGIDGPSRMLLQVGLKGAPRSGASRPPMSVGLVLDLRGEIPVEVAAGMRALALAFSEAREAGDRFSLIVAGRSPGVAIGPDEFKHGPLVVAFDRLLTAGAAGAAGAGETGEPQDLAAAVAAAFAEASHRDDPDAPLGTSAVVVVTGQSLGESVDVLADLAHQGAVAGIPLSVVGVGSGASLPELDRLALAGQGSRRLLEARSDAPRLVEAELAADSDVVARAVRLRIRLAAGVRLVGIVGSRRLDEAQSQQVREAERSIDLRLSQNLGIESDRGEDEDGIQVVIPGFRAGDAHVVLLDVVAPGPGALADVSVRYKDLVFLRNGVARASLSLPAGAPAPGPLERNVLKNLLAWRLAESLGRAGAALAAGDADQARTIVDEARSLRGGLLACVPGLGGDAELGRDVAMLQEYSRLLSGGTALQSHLADIADSLRYAGRLKLHSRSTPLTTGTL